jgi:hypothetical protein
MASAHLGCKLRALILQEQIRCFDLDHNRSCQASFRVFFETDLGPPRLPLSSDNGRRLTQGNPVGRTRRIDPTQKDGRGVMYTGKGDAIWSKTLLSI